MLRNVYFYHDLGEQFGEKHQLDVSSIGEVMCAFRANYGEKFIQYIREGEFHVLRGKDLDTAELFEDEEQLRTNFEEGDFHIVPHIEGSKSPWISFFIGAVMVGVGLYFPGPWSQYLIAGGVALMFGSVAQMLAPTPTYDQSEPVEQRPSFIYSGPLNSIEQGGSIPLVYGRCTVGSTVIQAEMDVEEI